MCELNYTNYIAAIGEPTPEVEEDDEIDSNITMDVDEDVEEEKFQIESVAVKKEVAPRSKLPSALQGLYGEAVVQFAHGNIDTAKVMCMEIIRQVPRAPEPFRMLEEIYESEDPDKSVNFGMIATHLSVQNAETGEEWYKYARMWMGKRNFLEAYACITKAVKTDRTNLTYHLLRIEAMERLGRESTLACFRIHTKLVEFVPFNDQTKHAIITSCIKAARGFYSKNLFQSAKECIQLLFKKVTPEAITSEHVNIYVEVLIATKEFTQALELIVAHCGIVLEMETQSYVIAENVIEEKTSVINYTIPHDLPIDIRAKFLVCLLSLKLLNAEEIVVKELPQFDVETTGDLLFDIAEVLMQEKYHGTAFKILDVLVKTDTYNMAAVWLRHAECLQTCACFNDAITSYKKVIALAPQLTEVRMTLYKLLKEQARHTEALKILDEYREVDDENIKSLLQRCKCYRQDFHINEYICAGYKFIVRYFKEIVLDRPLPTFHTPNVDEKVKLPDIDMKLFDDESVDGKGDVGWAIFKDILQITFALKLYEISAAVCLTMYQTKHRAHKDLAVYYMQACAHGDNVTCVMKNVHAQIQTDMTSVRLWNLYNAINQTATPHQRNQKFIVRAIAKAPSNAYVHVLYANNCLMSGMYKYAIHEYARAFKRAPSPLLALLLSVALSHLANQKSVKKHSNILQSFAFLRKYEELRGAVVHEVYFNYARWFHQQGIFPMAIEFYKKSLACDAVDACVDLKREAAYNLSMCYRKSGADHLALYYLRKYVVV